MDFFLIQQKIILLIFLCMIVSVWLSVCVLSVQGSGNWWPSSAVTHSRATLQNLKSKNMVCPFIGYVFAVKMYSLTFV